MALILRATRHWKSPRKLTKNKRNTEISERAKASESVPKSVTHSLEAKTENDDDFKLFADWAKKAPKEDQKLRGKGLGIFKFGFRTTKLPDAQG